ncbi:leucine-rich repeat domain-containing protein [Stomatobaculum longum]
MLNISDNRVEDIAPLTALPKLRYLCYTDNVIRNIGLLKDRGIVLTE